MDLTAIVEIGAERERMPPASDFFLSRGTSMGRMGIFLLRACALLALTAGSGCGGPGRPIKTEGLITLHGNPVAGATVTFHPEGGQGHPATGMTGDDGVFQLQTFAPDDGALPGDYKVTVIKTEGVAPPPTANDPAKHKEWMMKTMFKKPTQKAPASRLPKEYADASKTPLRVHVPHEGQVKLELKDAGGT